MDETVRLNFEPKQVVAYNWRAQGKNLLPDILGVLSFDISTDILADFFF